MKRIIFFFDGTSNTVDMAYPTNVTRLAQAVRRFDDEGVGQIIHYDAGVGTGENPGRLRRTFHRIQQTFGWGLFQNIVEAYKFLVFNYEPGDEISVFGFSRGAYTARSFVGLIRHSGIVSRRKIGKVKQAVGLYLSRSSSTDPDREEACLFRDEHCAASPAKNHGEPGLTIKYVGVWDTVGSLGLPAHFSMARVTNGKYRFHDTHLHHFVENARHAVAVDEKRKTFRPTLFLGSSDHPITKDGTHQEKLFPGTHTAVGGGGPVRGIQDAALEWIMDGAEMAGIQFDTSEGSPIYVLDPDHRAPLFNAKAKTSWSLGDRIIGMGLADRDFDALTTEHVHDQTFLRVQSEGSKLVDGPYQPRAIRHLMEALKQADVTEVKAAESRLTKNHPELAGLAPKRIEKYQVQPGDSLRAIAIARYGKASMADIIFAHNLVAGRIYDPNKIYAGREIELPIYDVSEDIERTAAD